MRRDSAVCYTGDIVVAESVREVLNNLEIACETLSGGVETAIRDAATWTFVPDFIVLDFSDVSDIEATLDNLIEAAPEGETEIIIIGGNEDIALYRRLRQYGVLDYFPKPLSTDDLARTVTFALQKTRERRGEIAREKLISVTHASPGSGASTIAHCIAYFLALSEKETFLFDLDIIRGVQYLLAGETETSGFIDILSAPARLDKLFLERTRKVLMPKLSLLSANLTPDQALPGTDEGINMLLANIRDSIDFCVFDAPIPRFVGKDILSHSSRIVIVAEPTLLGLRGISQIVSENDFSRNQDVVIVLNKMGTIKEGLISTSDFKERFELNVVEVAFDPKTPQSSILKGTPLNQVENPIWKSTQAILASVGIAAKKSETTSLWKKLLS